MNIRSFVKEHFVISQSIVAIAISVCCLISLGVYNSCKKDVVYKDESSLVSDDNLIVNIDLNNFLFNSFNDGYTVHRFYFDREKQEFLDEGTFNVNSVTYYTDFNYIECEFINNGYDENKDFFINNALNNYAYISSNEIDVSDLKPFLNELKDEFNQNYLLNKVKNIDEVFDGNSKKIVCYYSLDELFSEYEMLNYLSLYSSNIGEMVLVDISSNEEAFKELVPNISYIKKERVVMLDYDGTLIKQVLNVDEATDYFKSILS